MKIYKHIILYLLAAILLGAGCNDGYDAGEFEVDESLQPKARTDAPDAPSAVLASYDEYCDKVVVSWEATIRTSAYDLYKNGVVFAQGLTDTFYVDNDALLVDTEYSVYAKNHNGDSESAGMTVGRMAGVPPTPVNFNATSGAYDSKVELSWDPVDYALYYVVKRDGVVLNDRVVGTTFLDNVNAPTTETEYSMYAVGNCGESAPVVTTGYADPLIAFRFPVNETFDGYSVGYDLSSTDMFQHFFHWDMTGGPGSFKVSDDTSVSGAKCAKAVYNDVTGNASAEGNIEIICKNFDLLEGQRYRISYRLKCTVKTQMFLAVDKDGSGNINKADGEESYLLPTWINPKGNGLGIQMAAKPEWTEVSYEFPATGVNTKANFDPDPVVEGWVPATIQAGQTNPLIQIKYYLPTGAGPNGEYPPIYIDDLMIELISE
ncbi:hypothetical protein [Carboxylicivirga marina]|uniref:hypothetical protein n=1 Tax=Carboxylicivirga marina TaxID=2800988 RepID=UPI002592CFB4|nr:hypothetical protein [uncultured Carboxylicivirga sp.]